MYTAGTSSDDQGCVCSINQEAAERKCICLSYKKTGESDINLMDCRESVRKSRAKRAILPLPASESEEGEKPRPKHGQDATAPVNGKDQRLRARRRRASFKQLPGVFRSANTSSNDADTDASNSTNCYKPNWCVCHCVKVKAKAFDCTCGDMPAWSCAVKPDIKDNTAKQDTKGNSARMSSCVSRMSSH